MTALVIERGGAFLAATHSADFLEGCLLASERVQIVRLEYSAGRSKATVIPVDKVKALIRNPMLRSASVISSLFYDGVVVCEADNDRAFYDEIHHRISGTEEGRPSVLFINAKSKQTVKDIVGPLRDMGVPAAAIVDIDIVKDGGKVWMDWLRAGRLPLGIHSGSSAQRASMLQLFVESGKDMKKDGGIEALDQMGREAVIEFCNILARYGIFIVQYGELESWLPELGATGKAPDWVIDVFGKMGADPGSGTYVRPAPGGVWDFVRGVLAWVGDPSRKQGCSVL